MIKAKYFLTWLCILAIASCKKVDVPGPDMGNPVFEVSTTIGGMPFDWEAGIDSLYMFTDTVQDTLGIYTFTGTLQREGCPSLCGPALRFEIRDFQPVSGSGVAIEQALAIGDYGFQYLEEDTTFIYSIQFEAELNPGDSLNAGYNWEFSDGQIASGPNPLIIFSDNSPIGVNLTATNGFLEERITTTVYFDPFIASCSVDFDANAVQGGFLLQLIANNQSGVSPFSYSWFSGDTSNPVFVPFDSTGIVLPSLLCLNMVDNNGCSSDRCKTVYYLNPAGGLVGNTELSLTHTPNIEHIISGDSEQFSKVRITYMDENGVLFSSDILPQASNSSFKIVANEAFDLNENGLPTRKLQVEFQCTLWDEFANFLTLNGQGTIALGHP